MNNTIDTRPRFVVWKEYSPVFDTTRYNVYDDGHHCKGFDTETEAIDYAKELESINPSAPIEVMVYGDYRIVKYFSFVYMSYRFRTENRNKSSYSGLSYWELDQLFSTFEEAKNYCATMNAADEACTSNNIEQVYP